MGPLRAERGLTEPRILLKLNEKEDNVTITPKKAAKEILAIESKLITVSLVFCVNQAQSIVESSKLQAPNSKERDLDEADIVKQFRMSIANWFSLLYNHEKVNDAATIDNSFMLRYSLPQKVGF